MSCASAGLALPANSAIVSSLKTAHLYLAQVRLRYRTAGKAHGMAGVEGFEPPYGGIKTRKKP